MWWGFFVVVFLELKKEKRGVGGVCGNIFLSKDQIQRPYSDKLVVSKFHKS